jgi:uncharacterized OB-fold protein
MPETRSHYLPDGLPIPKPAPDRGDDKFWEALRRHELMVQYCKQCGTRQMEPECVCYNCQSFDLGWQKVAGRGRIYSWIRPWYAAHPALRDFGPYLVVLVELEEDRSVRMAGNLLGDPHQEVKIGAPVEAVYEDHPEEGFTLLHWRTI